MTAPSSHSGGQNASQEKVPNTIRELINLPWGALAGKDGQILPWSTSDSPHKKSLSLEGPQVKCPQNQSSHETRIRLKKLTEIEKNATKTYAHNLLNNAIVNSMLTKIMLLSFSNLRKVAKKDCKKRSRLPFALSAWQQRGDSRQLKEKASTVRRPSRQAPPLDAFAGYAVFYTVWNVNVLYMKKKKIQRESLIIIHRSLKRTLRLSAHSKRWYRR